MRDLKTVGECFHSFLELFQTFMTISVTRMKREENALDVTKENPSRKEHK